MSIKVSTSSTCARTRAPCPRSTRPLCSPVNATRQPSFPYDVLDASSAPTIAPRAITPQAGGGGTGCSGRTPENPSRRHQIACLSRSASVGVQGQQSHPCSRCSRFGWLCRVPVRTTSFSGCSWCVRPICLKANGVEGQHELFESRPGWCIPCFVVFQALTIVVRPACCFLRLASAWRRSRSPGQN